MTTHTKRRGRRSLAAILAAMLMASVLAVVAGSPAQAANTAEEALWDHDGRASTAEVRRFAGQDRYDTAIRLAKAHAEQRGGIGNVPVAFVASGVSLVDAVSSSGLVGDMAGPVLLTEGDKLHPGVADFIEDYGVGTVYVLGGTAAVADAVIMQIKARANAPKVTRIWGADRYATAAAAAGMLQASGVWCNGSEPAALLVNGGDVSLAEALAAGPFAARLALPMLLTAAESLPDATLDYIEDRNIEHVVIIGGENSISADVQAAVVSAGVDTVERIGGATPAAVSVALADLAVKGDCSVELAPVNAAKAALVSARGADVPPDGFAAVPVLTGESFVPVLLVGDTLPPSVRDYLAATPTTAAGQKVNYELLAIGGTAAVSVQVMADALDAARSAAPLTVEIYSGSNSQGGAPDATNPLRDSDQNPATPEPVAKGDQVLILRFNDEVISQDDPATTGVTETRLTDRVRDILEVNGVAARIAPAGVTRGTNRDCDVDTVTVTLSEPLNERDSVAIVGGQTRLGANGDLRPLADASVTVPPVVPDRTGPRLSIVAVEDEADGGTGVAIVTVTDSSALGTDTTSDDNIVNVLTAATGTTAPTRGEMRVTRTAGTAPLITTPAEILLANGSARVVLTFDTDLKAGDRIIIDRGALRDEHGNQSSGASVTVSPARALPTVESVLLSTETPTMQATAVVPTDITRGDGLTSFDSNGQRTSGDDDANPDIWIVAKKTGGAAGAHGNRWAIRFDKASTHDPAKPADIDVRVSTKDKFVSVRLVNGTPTYGQLKAALEGNSTFDGLFEVKLDPLSPTAASCGTSSADRKPTVTSTSWVDDSIDFDAGTPATGTSLGETKVAIEVNFNAPIRNPGLTANTVNASPLLSSALADVIRRRTTALADLGLNSLVDTPGDTRNLWFSAPGTTVRYVATTDDPEALPIPGYGKDRAEFAAAMVATGYASDVGATDANESQNGKTLPRWLQRNTSVSAPK